MSTEAAAVSDTERRSGDVIARRYQLQRKLGSGGMGVVWVAHSLALDVDVALKMLRLELIGEEAVEGLAREARTAAQLGHPALVSVLDYGVSERGEPFLAMELLDGEDLAAQLQREHCLPPERVVTLLLPIIDGLGVAHERGIVHRDLKPANVFVAVDGQGRTQPKLLDFGIAKLEPTLTSTRLTQAGAVLGSPLYLSPEQAEGMDDIDHRSDIWSLGVVLYEAITGVTPFHANNYNALLRRIAHDEPTPITALGKGDPSLWLIIERCLRKDPAQRWSSMWEVGEALALWAFERGVRVDAAARSIKHDWLQAGLAEGRIAATSQAPPHTSSLPPVATVTAASSELEPARLPGRRPIWPALVGATLAVAGLLAFRHFRAVDAPPTSPEEPASVAVSSNMAVASPTSPGPAPSVQAQALRGSPESPREEEPLTARPSREANAVVPVVTPARRRPTVAKSSAAQKPAPSSHLEAEFGF